MGTCSQDTIDKLKQAATDAQAQADTANTEYEAQMAKVTAAQETIASATACRDQLMALDPVKYKAAIDLLNDTITKANQEGYDAQVKADAAKAKRDTFQAAADSLNAAASALEPDASGATAGTPGTWTPDGAEVPADLAETIAWGVVASPATPWTDGQYVSPKDDSKIHWDGTTWKTGVAVAATSATAGKPGAWKPDGSTPPKDLADTNTRSITASPATPWTDDQYVSPLDNSKIHWDGTTWKTGQAVAATGATAGEPGTWTPTGSTPPKDLADAKTRNITASPTTAWTENQSVKPLDNSDIYWDGTTWKTGKAPAPGVTTTARSR